MCWCARNSVVEKCERNFFAVLCGVATPTSLVFLRLAPRPREGVARRVATNRTQPTWPNPNQPNSTQPKPNPIQPNLNLTQPDLTQRMEPNRTEPNRTEPNRTEPNRTEPNRTEPNRTEPNRTEPNRTQPHQTEIMRPFSTGKVEIPTITNPLSCPIFVCLAFPLRRTATLQANTGLVRGVCRRGARRHVDSVSGGRFAGAATIDEL